MLLATIVLAHLVCAVPSAQDTPPLEAARALIDEGQGADAAQLLRGVLDAGGQDVAGAAIMLTDLLIAEGDPSAAIEVLDEVDSELESMEIALANGRAYFAMANQIDGQGAAQEDIRMTRLDGQTWVEKAVELAPLGDTTALVELGTVALYQFRDSARAMDIASGALADAPDDAELLNLRGNAGVYVYWDADQAGDVPRAKGAWEMAVGDLKAAIKLLPRERTDTWGRLSWLYEAEHKGELAVDAAMEILDRAPETNFDEIYRLAKKYSVERNWKAAGKAMEKMVSLSAREISTRLRQEPTEELPQLATNMGNSIDPFVQVNDRATARAILKAILAADPVAPDVWHNYAVMCEETSRFEDAFTAYERLIEIDGENPRAYNDLGALLHHRLNRDLDRAQDLYQKCIDLASDQLLAQNLTADQRVSLNTARTVAQGSLDQLAPPSSGGSLLDGLLDGLGSLSLPDLPDSDDDEEDAENGDDETEDGDDAEEESEADDDSEDEDEDDTSDG
jgi:tetratricopeptide (TPR) repeat protein